MQVFRALAGYSLGRADIVRRAMAKKKHEVMRREREFFIYGETDENGNVITEGAVKRGVSEEVASEIFDEMSSFSSYAFNKAHACAYSFVAYRTAYLKCHYPAEYFASLMTSMMDSAAKISLYTAECRKNGIRVLPPSINKSGRDFTPDSGAIRFGLSAIKNLGIGLIERLISEREQNGEYTSMYDFCYRNYSREMGRKALEGLIKSGALDDIEPNRRQMLYNIEGVLAATENERRFSGDGQLNLFDEMGESNAFVPEKIDEMDEKLKLELEKEATGLYLSGHPMDKYADFVKAAKFTPISDIAQGKRRDGERVSVVGIVSSLKVRQLKNNSLLATALIEDVYGAVGITVFSKAYNEYKHILTSNEPVILTGRISEREDRDTEIICERAENIPLNAEKTVSKIKSGLYLKISNIDTPLFEKVKAVLEKYKGDTAVYIYCTQTGKKLLAPNNLWVNYNSKLSDELIFLLGEENVKMVK